MSTADPTDNCAPYGTKDYVRSEFSFVAGVRASTMARAYTAGKRSTLIYKTKKDKDALKCFHCYLCICAPCTCALMHTKALTKYTYTHLYDDRIQTNVPISCCCYIGDNTRVYYLDRDFAQKWEKASTCKPLFTHCSCPNEKFGTTVIGYGDVNHVMTPGGRRLSPPLLSSLPCKPQCQGGPFFGECFSCCCPEWVCFPFLKDASAQEFMDKVQEQRKKIVEEYNIVPGKPVEAAPSESEDMQRV